MAEHAGKLIVISFEELGGELRGEVARQQRRIKDDAQQREGRSNTSILTPLTPHHPGKLASWAIGLKSFLGHREFAQSRLPKKRSVAPLFGVRCSTRVSCSKSVW